MIELNRAVKPTYLTDEKVSELTDEFKTSGKSVWNHEQIKKPLLDSSHGKCAYCECDLLKESNYMEVEHFEDKCHNPDKVVIWNNLLPSCKKCNGAKGTHDVMSEPIINPYDDDPRVHLSLRLYRLRGKTDKGKNTIGVTNLNNSTRLVISRFEIGEKINDLVETAWDRFSHYQDNPNTRAKNKLVGIVEGILEECQPNSSYSASTSTILKSDEKFSELVAALKQEGLWTDDLEELSQSSAELVLESA